jgi:hypothetical protein
MTTDTAILPPTQLPLLPHPSTLIDAHDAAAQTLLLEQARQNFEQLSSLRNQIESGDTCRFCAVPDGELSVYSGIQS